MPRLVGEALRLLGEIFIALTIICSRSRVRVTKIDDRLSLRYVRFVIQGFDGRRRIGFF